MIDKHQIPLIIFIIFAIKNHCSIGATINRTANDTNNSRAINFNNIQNFAEIAYRFFAVNVAVGNTTQVDNLQCNLDIQRISYGIRQLERWALEFPDSWGRLPVGLMWAHDISLGQFEECIAAGKQFRPANYVIKGKYCLANIPIKNFMKSITKNSSLSNQSKVTSYLRGDPEYFELGVCVPSSCTSQQIDSLLKEIIKNLLDFDITENTIRDGYCKINEPIVLRPIDIFAIVFLVVILLCMLASSIYDYVKTKRRERKRPLFMAFSILTNAKKLFNVNAAPNPNVIGCLSGMRCFSMMWVVFAHGYMTFTELPHINRKQVNKWVETPFSMLIQNGSLCVDTFFFMSGLLILWGAFREMEKNKGRLNIPMMYFHRYVRLTPVLAVVVLFIMSFYKYAGAGPMWMKYGNQDKRCENTWWATLLYIQNYLFPNSICVTQSWYLAVDTQLYVFSPLVLIPLWKWGVKAVIPAAIFGFICLCCTFATFIANEFTLFRVQDKNVALRQRLTYYPTHTRIPTWLIGVLFGYFLFTKNRGKRIPLAKHWVIIGWTLAFGIMLTNLWGPYWRILPQNPNATLLEGAFYEPLSRTSWAMCIGWIVWACYNGHGGLINEFLSWTFFTAFSRLTYCMYVIHRIIQWINAGRLQTDTHFSDYDAVLQWWHDFGLTLCVSIFATLAFEAPILGIEKAIFSRSKDTTILPATSPTTTNPTTKDKKLYLVG